MLSVHARDGKLGSGFSTVDFGHTYGVLGLCWFLLFLVFVVDADKQQVYNGSNNTAYVGPHYGHPEPVVIPETKGENMNNHKYKAYVALLLL